MYRCVGEHFHHSCVIERRPFGGGSVMVWGGISSRGRTAIVVVDGTLTGIRYRDEIIQAHVLSFVQQRNATLQQDNVRRLFYPEPGNITGFVAYRTGCLMRYRKGYVASKINR